MMPVAFGNIFEKDWFTEVDGDGVLTYSASGKSFKASSSYQVDDGAGGLENRAYLRNFIQVRGGERITVRVMCRMISGSGAIAVDYPNRGNPKVSKILDAAFHSHWMEHTVTAEVGEQILTQDDSVSIVVGSVLTSDGEMEVSRINVDIEGGANGALRTHAHGMINIDKAGGVVTYTVDDSYVQSGNVSVAAGGTGVVITTPPINDTEGQNRFFNPLIFTSVYSTDKYGVVAYPSKFDPATGAFTVQFSDSTGLLDFATTGLADGQSVVLNYEVRLS